MGELTLRDEKCPDCDKTYKWGALSEKFWAEYHPPEHSLMNYPDNGIYPCAWCVKKYKLVPLDPNRKAKVKARNKTTGFAGLSKKFPPTNYRYCHICDVAMVSKKHMEGHLDGLM